MNIMRKEEIKQVKLKLQVNIFYQDDAFVAYTPALDMSTYGSSKKEAQANFEEMVETFLSSFDDAREFAQVLESLGWTKQKSKWQPPQIISQQISVPASLMTI